MKDVGLVAALGCGNVQYLVNFVLIPVFNIVNLKLDRIKRFVCYIFMSQGSLEIIAVTELELNILDFYFVVVRAQQYLTLIYNSAVKVTVYVAVASIGIISFSL